MPFVSSAIAIAAIVGGAAAVGGTVVSAIGQGKAANAAEATGNFNAAAAIEEANTREQQQRYQDRRIMARAKSLVGTSGVELQGSPLDVMAESARQAEMDALIIRRGGQLEAESQIRAGKAGAATARTNMASTIISGGAGAFRAITPLFQNSYTPGSTIGNLPMNKPGYSAILLG